MDLVVLDMVMEDDFDGLDTYLEIRRFKPKQKVVIAGGFAQTERVQRALSLGARSYLQKPYSLDALAVTVRDTLDRP